MAPMFNWGVKESHRGTPVVVKMENPNWSMVELEGPSEEDLLITNPSSRDKGRGKNAKQLTWVLLLKAHRAAGCLTSIASALFGFVSAVKRRVASGRTDADIDGVGVGGGREKENPTVVAYFKGWHFSAPHLELWAPAFGVKDFKKIKPIPKGGHGLDLESGDKGFFPMVYQQSIAAVCNLDWPKSKFLIQVLDDSDDPVTSSLIQEECQCELPESYEAYRKQQHRWHSGPMQLFRLCLPDVIQAKISIWKKFNMIFLFFLLRKLVLPFYSFTLFCIILPMTMFVPEAEIPAWVVCYIPAVMSFLNILPAPKAFPFIVPYLLFENTMSVTKFNAMISGLFQLGSAYEWVVTKKSGRSSEGDLVSLIEKPKHQRGSSAPDLEEMKEEIRRQEENVSKKKKKHNKMYMKELALASLLLTASARSLLSAQGIHFYFLLFQGVSFLLVGLDLIGEQVD
ncbi:hypothetical protein TSUD_315710 [Trifolium subterraneum]|uniref:Glycosyltransferase 2-like domain-containing protein n=1 Tax=Trifolium subterraneum TaxID=3900 RepID=A0A2Z6NMT0_TRISU|nr:hypothetical protein TSUD_315710 [Trifolium subterraneum]